MQQNEYRGDYPAEWPQISKRTKDEADWRCMRCIHPFSPINGSPGLCDGSCDLDRGSHRKGPKLGLPKMILHLTDPRVMGLNYGVHHFDGDKSNNRWWNRMALCNSCHLKIQSSVVPARPWLFEHSEWARIFIGGFYAWHFVQAEPTRETVEAFPELFLAIGQPWLYPQHRELAEAWIRDAKNRTWTEFDSPEAMNRYRPQIVVHRGGLTWPDRELSGPMAD